MLIYNYDDEGIFIAQSEAYLDDLESEIQGESVWVLPANATFIAPPAIGENQVAKFENGSWNLVSDFRGQAIYSGIDSQIVEELGELPEGWSLTPSQAYTDAQARAAEKASKLQQIAELTVTIDGMVFDANEFSQNRMMNAIKAAEISNVSTVGDWILSDNSVAQNLALSTLREALAMAVTLTSAIWLA